MKISDTPSLFKNSLTYFTNPSVFVWKNLLLCFLSEADNFGSLRFDAFDFQLKFNFKYTNFALKEN